MAVPVRPTCVATSCRSSCSAPLSVVPLGGDQEHSGRPHVVVEAPGAPGAGVGCRGCRFGRPSTPPRRGPPRWRGRPPTRRRSSESGRPDPRVSSSDAHAVDAHLLRPWVDRQLGGQVSARSPRPGSASPTTSSVPSSSQLSNHKSPWCSLR